VQECSAKKRGEGTPFPPPNKEEGYTKQLE